VTGGPLTLGPGGSVATRCEFWSVAGRADAGAVLYGGPVLTTVAVAGYRSLRDVVVRLGRLTVVTGANGSGKSSLYRAMRLLAACADGSVIGALAREGGLQSALWAGPEFPARARRRGMPTQGTVRTKPVSLRMGFAAEDGLGYLVDLGIPVPGTTAFGQDPEIKRELVWAGPVARPSAVLLERAGPLVRSREGRSWTELGRRLPTYLSMLGEFADPNAAPELTTVREVLRGWRFYDSLRTDEHAPARRRQVGTRTPVLAGDGSDLAAALKTIQETGDSEGLVGAVADAFPGARISIRYDGGWFEVGLEQDGVLRRMGAAELSDGTLRYLLLVAALMSPRPPSLLVLNEPETSLHPDLLPALARLIRDASRGTQIVVVSHSRPLLAELGIAVPTTDAGDRGDDSDDADGDDSDDADDGDDVDDADRPDRASRSQDGQLMAVNLVKRGGETLIRGQTVLSAPSWEWGVR
jgi:predicted ATPase